ncbi:hypothetical protein VKT23_010289 [Stygiomarasmius scandens]|uniref:CFEM domain-containing protein n=1 Tax=Marasmiellus scandens TaxID=2682957 RepID=A0ABR1JC25_9AGAR
MRFSAVFVCSALAALASAVPATPSLFSRAELPACAVTCASEINPAPCDAADSACLCANKEFVYMTSNCVEDSCSGVDIEPAMTAIRAICDSVGVPLAAFSIL